MASDDRVVAATHSPHEKRGRILATNCLGVRETLLHWDEAEYRRLYSNMLDARCFGAVFSDRWNFMMFDCLGIRRDTDISAWKRR